MLWCWAARPLAVVPLEAVEYFALALARRDHAHGMLKPVEGFQRREHRRFDQIEQAGSSQQDREERIDLTI
jgi:hypothetical protein